MPFRTRKSKKKHTVTPEHNHTNSALLRLPGELRNEIYSYVIYPTQRSIQLAFKRKGTDCHFSESVLSPGIFRACRQIRAEALSYLCSAKHVKICGSDTAIAFFDVLGDGIRSIRRMSIAQPIRPHWGLPREQIDMLFYYLDQAESLQYLKIEMAMIGHPYTWSKENIGPDWVFLEKMSDFVKKRDGMKFLWEAGVYDLRPVNDPERISHFDRAKDIRELLGKEHEGRGCEGTIRLW